MLGDQEVPPGIDPATGEIINPEALKRALQATPPEVPGQKGLAAMRQQKQDLETSTEVYTAVTAELRKLELAGERMAEVRKLLHGWTDKNGNYIPGAEFEFAEVYDEQVRILYSRCNDPEVDKKDRPRWPGEDVRNSIVNEFIDKSHRENLASLKGEMKTLENYVQVVRARLTGLVTLLSYHKEEMKMSWTPSSPAQGEATGSVGGQA